MKRFENLSIIIATIDETDSLRKTVEILTQTCNRRDIKEIIVVVCEKTTAECMSVVGTLQNIAQNIPIRLYTQKEPGLGSALNEAFDLVKGSHLVYLGADMDTDPFLVSVMVEKAKENPDAIILASRWLKGGGFEGYGAINRLLNFVFQKLVQVIYCTKVSDLTYGYRIIPEDKLHSIVLECRSPAIGLESNLKFIRLKYRFVEVPTLWRARSQGKAQTTFFMKLKYTITVIKVRFATVESFKNKPKRES